MTICRRQVCPDEYRFLVETMSGEHTLDDPAPTDHSDDRDPSVADGSGVPSSIDEMPDIEPMTFSLMGRFFAVPLVIISAIVGGAILVVLLFGGTSGPDDRTVDQLLTSLEATSGERSLGILLPREKELWQTALELGVRLKAKDKEKLSDEDLQTVADRLARMVKEGAGNLDRLASSGQNRVDQREIRSRRLEFLIHALGRTELPIAVDTLVDIIRRSQGTHVLAAMQELGDLHESPLTRVAVGPITDLLRRTDRTETLLVACTALSVLAEPTDVDAIAALVDLRLARDGEVAWSAALALARLGSNAGKSTLMDLMDRPFLSSEDRYHITGSSGTVHRYVMPPARIDQVMIAALDAASHLSEADLWATIDGLQTDPSPAVRAKAIDVVQAREANATLGGSVED